MTLFTGLLLMVAVIHVPVPGAWATRDLQVICHTKTHGRRHVSESLKKQIAARDHVAWAEHAKYEFDHIIPLELGGANAMANLYAQPWPEAHVKDKLENHLHREVCAGRMPIAAAQTCIAKDWAACAKKHGLPTHP